MAGVVITALAALAIGAIMMRPSGHFLSLGTIAWGLSLFFLLGKMELLVKYDGINGIPALELFGWILDSGRSIYYLIWMVVPGYGRVGAKPAEQPARTCNPRVARRGTLAEARDVNSI